SGISPPTDPAIFCLSPHINYLLSSRQQQRASARLLLLPAGGLEKPFREEEEEEEEQQQRCCAGSSLLSLRRLSRLSRVWQSLSGGSISACFRRLFSLSSRVSLRERERERERESCNLSFLSPALFSRCAGLCRWLRPTNMEEVSARV
ncbi:unnamed protein product, partial [Ectocarpus fasciculatus]